MKTQGRDSDDVTLFIIDERDWISLAVYLDAEDDNDWLI